MATSVHEPVWLSAYIFFRSADPVRDCDDIVLQVLKPIIGTLVQTGQILSAFFIRYWELGPHVRLRLLTAPALASAVESYVEDQVAMRLPPRAHARPESVPVNGRQSPAPGLWWVPYEPEIERYGGRLGVSIAEELFAYSTTMAIELLEGIRSDAYDRRGIALASTIAALEPLVVGDATEGRAISRLYQHLVTGTWDPQSLAMHDAAFMAGVATQESALREQTWTLWAASNGGALPTPMDLYSGAFRFARRRLSALAGAGELFQRAGAAASAREAIRHLAPSYLHMTNNRLGISRLNEGYLANILYLNLDPRNHADDPLGP
jgi:thiopeptide-type bacteriocin biosynthesis protein